jgi:hypothetical protein
MIGKGTVLSYAAAQAGPFTPLPLVKDINGPDSPIKKLDSTTMDTVGNDMESEPGMGEPAPLKFDVKWSASAMVTIAGLRGQAKWWKIAYLGGGYHLFPGYVANNPQKTPVADTILISMEVQPTGAIQTFAGVQAS